MTAPNDRDVRLGGGLLLAGAVTMLAGAAVHFSDPALGIDGVVDGGTITAYLVAVAAVKGSAYANLGLWILGVGLLGLGGVAVASAGDPTRGAARAMARFAYIAGATLAWASFIVWIALVRAAPDLDPAMADVLAFVASRTDWLATSLIVGAGPALLSTLARIGGFPGWLRGWGIAAGGACVLTWIALIAGGLESYGFLVVPVGVLWSVAAGIVTLRRARVPAGAAATPYGAVAP